MTQVEKKNNPIQSFKDWEANYKAEKAQRELENIRQGLFRREDKILLLESILYTRIHDGDSIEDVVMAIEVLQANKVSNEGVKPGGLTSDTCKNLHVGSKNACYLSNAIHVRRNLHTVPGS